MVRHDKVTLRYSKAIFAHCKSAEKALPVIEDLAKFLEAYRTSTDLQRILHTGLCSALQRRQITEDLAKKLAVSDSGRRVLAVIAESGRMENLESILGMLRQYCLESKGVQPMRVESAIEVKSGDKKKVEEKFKKVLGKTVEAEYVLSPTLFGGLRVTAGARTFDGTLSGWLTNLEEKLVGGDDANHSR